MMIILLVVLVLMIIPLTEYSSRNQPVALKTDESILDERYARGEISFQEYQAKKQQLNR
jgi:uncharacterized membrane protein